MGSGNGWWCIAPAMVVVVSFGSMSNATELPSGAIELHASGNEITLSINRAARREVIARLLSEHEVGIEWLNEDVAEESIKGEYHGQIDMVISELLDHLNFVIHYKSNGEKLQISRIVVLGPVSAKTSTSQAHQSAPIGRVQRPKGLRTDSAASLEQRQKRVREKMLERMRTTGEAVKRRAAMLPPGRQPMRTQAITTVPSSAALLQHGNVPYVPPTRRR